MCQMARRCQLQCLRIEESAWLPLEAQLRHLQVVLSRVSSSLILSLSFLKYKMEIIGALTSWVCSELKMRKCIFNAYHKASNFLGVHKLQKILWCQAPVIYKVLSKGLVNRNHVKNEQLLLHGSFPQILPGSVHVLVKLSPEGEVMCS